MTLAICSSALNKALTRTALFLSLGCDRVCRLADDVMPRGPFRPAFLTCLIVLTGLSQAQAGTVTLGAAQNYVVYDSGNLSQTGGDLAASGAVAVQGNASFSNFTVPGIGNGNTSLVVGGNLNWSGGAINSGNAQVGGTYTFGSSDVQALASGETLSYGSKTGNTNPGSMPNNPPKFNLAQVTNGGISSSLFSSATSTMNSTSSVLANQTQSANATAVSQYGTLTLTDTKDTGTIYFNVNSALLAGLNTITINAANNATVVVNVNDTSVSLSNLGMNINGTSASDTLFNFYNASSLSISGLDFDASILAPSATFTPSNGHTDGNVMVGGINTTSYFEYHTDALFSGTLTVAAVPEPSTIVMTGLGVIGAGFIVAGHSRKSKSRRVAVAH